MALIERIRARLESEFPSSEMIIEDDSARHAGHREAAGRFHLKVRLLSSRFTGLDRVARHRLVYAALGEELAGPIHALNITALAPGEST
ncbi:MAG: BolA family transcriptional regulator [Gammaproteobacteria bacterium]|nr:BolA family transcriptional regulator [Gammaproteobacteria bacterium]